MTTETATTEEPCKIGLALSGGGSRAIAFHLGAMRALNDFGLLDKVTVMSCVSGGSVIGAMWAYSSENFVQFSERVERLLQRGIARDIALCLFHPVQLARCLAYLAVGFPINVSVQLLRLLTAACFSPLRLFGFREPWSARLQPPFCRWASRTTAFERALAWRFFPDLTLASPTREGVGIVVNSTDMRTGTAFRATNSGASSYVVGSLKPEGVRVATAVAASAAFPILLPALDIKSKFTLDGKEKVDRVLLTDGGVFDNLGTSALAPGRDPTISSVAVNLDYILCSSAGQGRPETRTLPYWLLPRLVGATMIMFRKLQDSGLAALHLQKDASKIKGFALAYLGQRDEKLANAPPDLIRRSQVVDYPTDFSAMNDGDQRALTTRGYQAMMAVLQEHCPELLHLHLRTPVEVELPGSPENARPQTNENASEGES